MRRYLFSALTAGAVLALAGCGAGDAARTITVERTVPVTADGRPFARPDADDGIADPAEPATPESPAPPANGDDGVPDPDPGPLPLDPGGAARVLADLRAAVGTTPQFTSIGLYDGYAVLYVRDPARPGNVDRYVWRDGAIGDPEPVRIRREQVAPAAFRASEVRLARVPALVRRALRVPVEAPEVCCVLISRRVPFSRDIQMTVAVSGPRESVSVIADATGRVGRIVR
jgi:hypothetical protein